MLNCWKTDHRGQKLKTTGAGLFHRHTMEVNRGAGLFYLVRCEGRSLNNSPEIRWWVGARIAAPPSLQWVRIGKWGVTRSYRVVEEVAAFDEVGC